MRREGCAPSPCTHNMDNKRIRWMEENIRKHRREGYSKGGGWWELGDMAILLLFYYFRIIHNYVFRTFYHLNDDKWKQRGTSSAIISQLKDVQNAERIIPWSRCKVGHGPIMLVPWNSPSCLLREKWRKEPRRRGWLCICACRWLGLPFESSRF